MSGVVPNPLGVSEEEPKLKTMSQEQRCEGNMGVRETACLTAEKLKDLQEQDETFPEVEQGTSTSS